MKTHIIFSEENDISTGYLMDWLMYYQQYIFRYNGINLKHSNKFHLKDCINAIKINNNQNSYQYSFGGKIEKQIQSIYFRRPYHGISDFYNPCKDKQHYISLKYVNDKLKKHAKIWKQLVVESLVSKSQIILGHYTLTGLNKSVILQLAQKVGLQVPDTLITNSLSELEVFFNSHNQKIICKSLEEIIAYCSPENTYCYSTLSILIDNLNCIQPSISMSLFQEYIEKEFEIRIFYINGKCYSIAIFNQQNKNTKVDFRNYDTVNPNKMIPLNLPKSIVLKLSKLMKMVGLNVGSIDMIMDKNDNFYFLEINPVGQYDFVSQYGGYDLDYKIAEYLMYG